MIHVRKWGPYSDPNSGNEPLTLNITVTGASIERFTALISAALNCKDRAHPELKELGDMLTHGKVLQDYYAQQGMVKHADE